MQDEEPTYNFTPTEPANCIAAGTNGEGVYEQRGAHWYFDGRNGAVQIPALGHLTQEENLRMGRERLRSRYESGLGW